MRQAVIIAARRSAVAPRNGVLAGQKIHELAAPIMQACLTDAGLSADAIDEVLMGNALGGGGNPARVAALAAGLPDRVAGITLDRQCCSGLDAILLAEALIVSGSADTVLAGGAESYSRQPIRLRTSPCGGAPVPYDRPPFTPWPERDPDMIEAADTMARMLGIERSRQDAWAEQSHDKALSARTILAREIVGTPAFDPFTRRLTAKTCTRAKVICGSVTQANMAVAADAAAFCLIMESEVARRAGLMGLALLGGITCGTDPTLPALAPVTAIDTVLQSLEMSPDDLDQAEIMEAFAAQVIACVDLSGLNSDRVNPAGGAMARGHPIGASGAILIVRLFHDLGRSHGRGLAAIAAAGGIATAVVGEWQQA